MGGRGEGGGGRRGARLANPVPGGLRKVCFQCCFEDERRLVVTGDGGKQIVVYWARK